MAFGRPFATEWAEWVREETRVGHTKIFTLLPQFFLLLLAFLYLPFSFFFRFPLHDVSTLKISCHASDRYPLFAQVAYKQERTTAPSSSTWLYCPIYIRCLPYTWPFAVGNSPSITTFALLQKYPRVCSTRAKGQFGLYVTSGMPWMMIVRMCHHFMYFQAVYLFKRLYSASSRAPGRIGVALSRPWLATCPRLHTVKAMAPHSIKLLHLSSEQRHQIQESFT